MHSFCKKNAGIKPVLSNAPLMCKVNIVYSAIPLETTCIIYNLQGCIDPNNNILSVIPWAFKIYQPVFITTGEGNNRIHTSHRAKGTGSI